MHGRAIWPHRRLIDSVRVTVGLGAAASSAHVRPQELAAVAAPGECGHHSDGGLGQISSTIFMTPVAPKIRPYVLPVTSERIPTSTRCAIIRVVLTWLTP